MSTQLMVQQVAFDGLELRLYALGLRVCVGLMLLLCICNSHSSVCVISVCVFTHYSVCLFCSDFLLLHYMHVRIASHTFVVWYSAADH